MTSTQYLTSLFPSDLFNLFPNYSSPSVSINTCRWLSFLIGSLPGLLSWLGVGRYPTKMPLRYTWKTNPPRFIISTSSNPPLPQYIQRHTPASVFIDRQLSSEGAWGGIIIWLLLQLPNPSTARLVSQFVRLTDIPRFPFSSAPPPRVGLSGPRPPLYWALRVQRHSLWASSFQPPSPTPPSSRGLGPSVCPSPAAGKRYLLEP